MSKRVSTMYWDVNALAHYDSSGYRIRKVAYPYVVYKEKMLLNIYLVTDSSLTGLTRLSASNVFTASIHDEYGIGSSAMLMAYTLNTGINQAGDWMGSSNLQADETQGEISIQVDASRAIFGAALGTNQKQDCVLELQAFKGASSLELNAAFQIPIVCYNLVNVG